MKVFRAEIYRLWKDSGYWWFLVGLLGVAVFQFVGWFVFKQYFSFFPEELIDELKINNQGNVTYHFGMFRVQTPQQLLDVTVTNVLSGFLVSNVFSYYLAALIPFYSAQYRTKVMKYLMVSGCTDKSKVLSGVAVVLCLVNVLFVVYIAVILLCVAGYDIFLGQLLYLPNGLLVCIMNQAVSISAFAVLIYTITFLLHNYVKGVLSSVALVMSGEMMAKFMRIIFNTDVFSKYWVLNNTVNITLWEDIEYHAVLYNLVALTICAVCLVFLVLETKYNSRERYR